MLVNFLATNDFAGIRTAGDADMTVQGPNHFSKNFQIVLDEQIKIFKPNTQKPCYF